MSEASEYIEVEERGKGRIVIAFILAILLPPLGLIFSLYEMAKAWSHANIRNLSILAAILSIIAGSFYLYSYLDYNNYHASFHKIHRVN